MPRIEAVPPTTDDEILRASYEVDLSLIRWTRSLSLRERLRAATRTARMLERFRHAGAPPDAG